MDLMLDTNARRLEAKKSGTYIVSRHRCRNMSDMAVVPGGIDGWPPAQQSRTSFDQQCIVHLEQPCLVTWSKHLRNLAASAGR